MPGLFAAGVHGALLAAKADLQPGKSLSAFLDDACVTSRPNRPAAVLIICASLNHHAKIDLHSTCTWHAAGVEPPGLRELLGERPNDPPTWVGDPGLAPERQGFMVLGTPLGSAACVPAALRSKRQERDSLLEFNKVDPWRARLAKCVATAPLVRGRPLQLVAQGVDARRNLGVRK